MFHNLFFVISDELYNNIFVFLKKTVLLSDVHKLYNICMQSFYLLYCMSQILLLECENAWVT